MPPAKRKNSPKKDLILQTAARMFMEKGFAATSMRDLAEKIGIEAASLYNHISSKSQILDEIIFGVADECVEHLNTIEVADVSALEKIEAVIRSHTQMMINHYERYTVMVSEWVHLEQERLTKFAADRRQYVKQIENIIQKGIDDGELKPIIPYAIVLNILSSVRGLEFWQRSAKHYPAQQMEDSIVAHLIGGVKA